MPKLSLYIISYKCWCQSGLALCLFIESTHFYTTSYTPIQNLSFPYSFMENFVTTNEEKVIHK